MSVCPGGVAQTTATGSGVPCSNMLSGCEHGTHVAGIVAGHGNTFYGVARDAHLISIQVFSRINSAGNCAPQTAPCISSFSSDEVLGLERVFALRSTFNVAAVNMSLGAGRYFTYCDTTDPTNAALKAAIDNLRSVGIATIVASGNDGYADSMRSPACISSAISVGSTDDGSGGTAVDQISQFSNNANILNFFAPGNLITSSVPGGGFQALAGTSMAAPHVAGAWAVYKSKFPAASVSTVFTALQTSGTSVFDVRNGIIKPRLQLDAAMVPGYSLGATPTSQTVTAGNSITFTLSGTPQAGFSGDVMLSVTGLPAETSANIVPTSVTLPGSATIPVNTTDDAIPGTYTFTIVGRNGDIRRSALASLTILPSPKDFSISISPPSQTSVINSTVDYLITLTPIAGYSRTVTFRAVGLPAFATASFTPPSLPGNGTARVTVATNGNTPAGPYSVTVTGTDGHRQHSATATLIVPKYLSLSAVTDQKRILSGSSASFTMNLEQNYPANTAITVTGTPVGVTGTLSPPTLNGPGSTTLTLTTSGPAIEGTFPINVTAASSGLSRTAVITLTVLDTARYGTDGLVNTSLFGKTDVATASVLQTDGKLVVAGYVDNDFCLDCPYNDFTLARYNSDGSLDPGFGSAGKVVTDFGGDDLAFGVTIQPDGKLVVVGESRRRQGLRDFALARYNTDGTLDLSFGSGGKVTTDFGSNSDFGRAVAMQADGRIVTAGYSNVNGSFHTSLARYNSNGNLDPSFGSGGKVTLSFSPNFSDFASGIKIQSDQKIVVSGYGFNTSGGSNDFLLSRFLSNGTLDPAFGGTGFVFIDLASRSDDSGRALQIQNDGKIITAGVASCPSGSCFAVSRNNSNGTLDPTFGSEGKFVSSLGGNFASGEALALQPDGKILVAGVLSQPRVSNNFVTVRLDPNGVLDTSFGVAGKIVTDYIGLDDRAVSIVMQSDGKIIATGNAATGASYEFVDLNGTTRLVFVTMFALAHFTSNGDPAP